MTLCDVLFLENSSSHKNNTTVQSSELMKEWCKNWVIEKKESLRKLNDSNVMFVK
jgi:hypothetical protein